MENEARGEETDRVILSETAPHSEAPFTVEREPTEKRGATPVFTLLKAVRKSTAFLYGNKGAVLGIGAALFLLMIPLPEGLSPAGRKALSLVSLAFVFFMTEPIPLPGIALLIAVLEVLMGLGDSTEVARSFFNDSVFFIMGSLMIAVALVRQNLDKRIACWIVGWTGPQVKRLVFGMVAASALIASLLGEHTAAAIMLPVAVSLIKFSGEEPHKIKNLSVLLLLSIVYGAMIAGIGTPSGGARNAIMIAYWRELFHIDISYRKWIVYAYPMILIQIPIVASLLYHTFRPERSEMTEAVARLKTKVEEGGRMGRQDWIALIILGITLFMWITLGDRIGLGTISLIGVLLYLAAGTVRWEELNNGVNWGVILIYGGTLSLGLVMKETGAAVWISHLFLDHLRPLGLAQGIPFLLAVSLLTAATTSIITTGGAVGILGPIVLQMATISGTSVVAAGFVTAISSAFSYMTSFSTPVGNIAVGSGLLKGRHFLKAGWKMWIISILILIFLASTYWRGLSLIGDPPSNPPPPPSTSFKPPGLPVSRAQAAFSLKNS